MIPELINVAGCLGNRHRDIQAMDDVARANDAIEIATADAPVMIPDKSEAPAPASIPDQKDNP